MKPVPSIFNQSEPIESQSKPGTNMVNPELCKGLRRRISAAIYGWDCPLLSFIYPGFDCSSIGRLPLASSQLKYPQTINEALFPWHVSGTSRTRGASLQRTARNHPCGVSWAEMALEVFQSSSASPPEQGTIRVPSPVRPGGPSSGRSAPLRSGSRPAPPNEAGGKRPPEMPPIAP